MAEMFFGHPSVNLSLLCNHMAEVLWSFQPALQSYGKNVEIIPAQSYGKGVLLTPVLIVFALQSYGRSVLDFVVTPACIAIIKKC